jgi:transcriptional regulator with XRE-family HTH domain
MTNTTKQETTPTEITDDGYISNETARAFQNLLRGRRKELGQSQMEVASGANVSQALVSTLERGPHIGMRVYDLFKVLQYYRIRPDVVAGVLGFTPEESAAGPLDARMERARRIFADMATLDEGTQDRLLESFQLLVQGARVAAKPL